MIYIKNMFTKELTITLPVTPSTDHPDTRVTYSYLDGTEPWTVSFDVEGDVNVEDIMPWAEGGTPVERTPRTPTTRAGQVYAGPWITDIDGGTKVTSLHYPEWVGSNTRDALRQIYSISFPNVTTLPEGFFSYFSGLSEVKLPNLESIPASLFNECTYLVELDCPKVTSIGDGAFYESGLKRASFPLATSVEDWAFYGCNDLSKAYLPRVTSIGEGAFSDSSNLAMLLIDSIPQAEMDLQTWGVEDTAYVRLSDAYINPQYLVLDDPDMPEELIPTLYTVNAIPQYGEYRIWEGGDLVDSDAKSVWPEAFANGLGEHAEPRGATRESTPFIPFQPMSVDLPNVMEIGNNAFLNCDTLESVNLPSLLGNDSGTNFFKGCTSLNRLILTSMTRAKVLEIGYRWGLRGTKMVQCQGESTPQETTFAAPGGEPRDDMEYDENDERILVGYKENWEGGELEDTYALSVGDYAFDYFANPLMNQPTSIDLPNVTSIGEGAFQGCNLLTSVSVPSCTSIGDVAFYQTGLTSASFPLVTSIGDWAFGNCFDLVSLELPRFTTDEVANNAVDWNIPVGCEVTCSDGTVTIEPMSHLKYDENTYLAPTTASDPDGFEFLGGELVDSTALGVAQSTFDRDLSQVPQPTSISLPNATTIAQWAFYDCNELVSASFPNVTSIGPGAFAGTSLGTLVLTSMTTSEVSETQSD